MPPTIQSLWIGNALTNLEKLCAQSFMDHGHAFHLYTYGNLKGIPAGVVIKDGNEILPADKIFRHKGGSVAGFADWFRYALLAGHGGWWVDMDVVCIRPFTFGGDLVLEEGGDGLYTNSVIRAPKGHPLMLEMQRACREHKKREGSRFGFVGGPRPLTRAILKLELQSFAMPCTYYGAGGNWNTYCDKTFASGIDALSKDVHSIHFGNASASKNIFDKNARYDPESLFEQLKTKHQITTASDAKRITSAEIADAMIDKRLYKFERRSARKKKIGALVGGAAVLVVLILLGWLV